MINFATSTADWTLTPLIAKALVHVTKAILGCPNGPQSCCNLKWAHDPKAKNQEVEPMFMVNSAASTAHWTWTPLIAESQGPRAKGYLGPHQRAPSLLSFQMGPRSRGWIYKFACELTDPVNATQSRACGLPQNAKLDQMHHDPSHYTKLHVPCTTTIMAMLQNALLQWTKP